MNQKSKSTAALLAFFLGCWGVHQFYVGNKKKGVIMLIIGIFGLFFFVPLLITGIIALIDFIKYLTMSDAEFQKLCGAVNNNANPAAPSYSENNFQSQQSPALVEEPKEFTFCVECGAKIAKDSKFCPSCGAAQ